MYPGNGNVARLSTRHMKTPLRNRALVCQSFWNVRVRYFAFARPYPKNRMLNTTPTGTAVFVCTYCRQGLWISVRCPRSKSPSAALLRLLSTQKTMDNNLTLLIPERLRHKPGIRKYRAGLLWTSGVAPAQTSYKAMTVRCGRVSDSGYT